MNRIIAFIAIVFLAINVFLGIFVTWFYFTPITIEDKSLNGTVSMEHYEIRVFNVTYKNEIFLINQLTSLKSFDDSSLDSLMSNVEVADRFNVSIGSIEGFEGLIKNSNDSSFVNSKILVFWKKNKIAFVVSKTETGDTSYIAKWFVDKYEF
jgi:hypothetical protein